ncbi:MAG: metallophosphoesterase family protein [Halothiobacillus sp.]|jgi:calcineurin-like phosphoesterase family protein|nr:metallophosphoesterase family protein [Halothiobacillus sp.]
MTTFFTADQHFGHANILKYEADARRDERGDTFASVKHMDDALVEHWNAVVAPDDTVYALGDFSYKRQTIAEYLPLLNGRITLIVGNHDPYFKRCANGREAEARELAVEAGFADMHFEHQIEVEGVGLVKLHHFPYAPPNSETEEFLRYEHLRPKPTGEALLLHGHIHSQWLTRRYNGFPPMLNVGVDKHGLQPISEAEVVAQFVMLSE